MNTHEQLADVIHIGFPKTATTWLQLRLLASDDRIASLGKPQLVDSAYTQWFNKFVALNDYDFDIVMMQKTFDELNQRNAGRIGDRLKVISFERLSGELFSGLDSVQKLQRLKAVFGDARIVITIRDQVSMVESIYRHYIKGGGSLHIRELMYKNRSPSVDVFNTLHLLQKFRYDKVIAAYRETFGEENVHVVPFELLTKHSPKAYAEAYYDALGLELTSDIDFGHVENESLSYLGNHLLRWINQLISTPHSDSPLLRMVGLRYNNWIWRPFRRLDDMVLRKLSPKGRFTAYKQKWWSLRMAKRLLGRHDTATDELTIADDIRRAYAESNARTADLTGLPLADLGYSMPDNP